MNEAQQMHDELMNALLPIIPQTTYQDLRRLNTLAWAITGLCLTHTVRLGAWAQVLPSRAQPAASRERRFSRWLHHPAIDPPQWYLPVVQAAASGLARADTPVCRIGYDGPSPFCAHSCFPALSWSSDSSGVASHAPPEYERLSFEARPSDTRSSVRSHADRSGDHSAGRSRLRA